MARKLNEREKRMLLIGGVALAAILIFTYGTKGVDRWSRSRSSLAAAQRKLSEVETDQEKLAGLLALVPVFETPQVLEKQTSLFREKFYEQLKKAGINSEPPQPALGKKINIGGAMYQVVKIKCKGKGKLDQLLDLLGNLKENPYLVGVEELQIRCDTKDAAEKRKDKDVDIDLVVSTFVKESAGKRVEAKAVAHADPNSR
jgi:hypothetical protein